jgi:putative heme-binding domain-containing protein
MRLSTTEQLVSISANRGVEPKKLSLLVRGELDWIVMRALEKDRNRRYETANGFARDVEHYLRDEAVEACPPSAAYRFRKLARRNRGPLLAVATIFLVLLGGTVGTTIGMVGQSRQRVIAQRERAEAIRQRAEAQRHAKEAKDQSEIAQAVRKFQTEMLASADPEHGAVVFQQQCFVCHRVKGQGGNIGPNLDGVGVRGLHRLLEDILDPNRNVDPAFRQTVIETADGRTIAGVNLRTEGQLLVLNDAEGKEQSVLKKEIKTQTGSRLSLMPPTFEQTLSGKDLNDVVAYLLAQTNAAAK